ncbi:TRAP-type uncharacterized transport system substrate-binding protein [Rhodoblastus acidophilus]|uniref:hypothetical protein n=1 Tax=Rhodoblastus acidophilus TaxID=1074 RepID=UPI0022246303|nr:hypothetical protein [Rhodoblastus acidophilus]MCW2283414.1 TRAP-type uncharacterized transport system substrate-binding protein [Rhodoblastus acidophilus]MCW2332262.1 TRAP-type uncharacterized transport system substrate-binding protein [Rhodoblastus acidophilus]
MEDKGAGWEATLERAPVRRVTIFRRVLLWLAFVALSVLAALLAIKAERMWFDQAKVLKFCVSRGGVDQRFAERLQQLVVNRTSRIRIAVTPVQDPVAAFDHHECDLLAARSDAKLPATARALAILEKEIVVVIAHRGKAADNAAALRNRKLILATPGAANEALLRGILAAYGLPQADRRLVIPPDPAGVQAAFRTGPANLVIAVVAQSKLLQGNLLGGLTQDNKVSFADVPDAAALAKKLKGLTEETVEKGLFSAAPLLPADDLSTLSLEVRLVTRGNLRDALGAELTRLVLENKGDLAINGEFADAIAPPDTDKSAPMLAHRGAAQYVDDDEKTFIDLYGDYLYLGAPVAGAVGSFTIWLFGRWTRGSAPSAGDFTQEVLEIAVRVRRAPRVEDLDAADESLDRILHELLEALRAKTLSAEGLDVFRLAFEQTREWIRERRHFLARREPEKASAENLL